MKREKLKMKKIVNNLNQFFEVEEIDSNNIVIYTPFFMLDTNNTYTLNIKKENDKYFIHDGASIIQFINEFNYDLSNLNLQYLLNEYEDIYIEDNKVIVCETDLESLNFNIAKFIQFLNNLLYSIKN